MIMTTIMTDAAATMRLLTWLSPAFPTGAFAYSHGLEWAVETHDIHDGGTLLAWLHAVIAHGSARSDTILLRHAHRAAGEPDEAPPGLHQARRAKSAFHIVYSLQFV